MKVQKAEIVFISIVLLLAFLIKISISHFSNNDLQVLLWPVNLIVNLVGKYPSYYDQNLGYIYPDILVIIDSSCSGVNFFTISFCFFSIIGLRYFKSIKSKLVWFFTSIAYAYLITIVANGSRILMALKVAHSPLILPLSQHENFHQFQGLFVFFLFLIIGYLFFEYLIQLKDKNTQL